MAASYHVLARFAPFAKLAIACYPGSVLLSSAIACYPKRTFRYVYGDRAIQLLQAIPQATRPYIPLACVGSRESQLLQAITRSAVAIVTCHGPPWFLCYCALLRNSSDD